MNIMIKHSYRLTNSFSFILFTIILFYQVVDSQGEAYSYQVFEAQNNTLYLAAKAPPRIPDTRENQMDAETQRLLKVGVALVKNHEYEDAMPYLKRVLEKYPTSGKANMEIGTCYYFTKSMKEAIEHWEIAIKDDNLGSGNKLWLYRMLYASFLKEKEYSRAEVYAHESLKLIKGHFEYNSLAYIYALQGKNLDEALDLINKAILMIKDEWEDNFLFYYLDTKGWIYYKMNKYGLAEKELLEALKITDLPKKQIAGIRIPDSEKAINQYHLGMVYNAQGNIELARKYFIKALELNRSYIDAENALKKIQ
jgi:tetratricopeptide (TPR) repeat protein